MKKKQLILPNGLTPLPGYFVTFDGEIVGPRNFVLKTRKVNSPYASVDVYFYDDPKPSKRRFRVDHLVAMAFAERDIEEHEKVVHFDNDDDNNLPINLIIVPKEVKDEQISRRII